MLFIGYNRRRDFGLEGGEREGEGGREGEREGYLI